MLQVLQVLPVHKVIKVHLALQVQQVLLVHKVIKDLLALLG